MITINKSFLGLKYLEFQLDKSNKDPLWTYREYFFGDINLFTLKCFYGEAVKTCDYDEYVKFLEKQGVLKDVSKDLYKEFSNSAPSTFNQILRYTYNLTVGYWALRKYVLECITTNKPIPFFITKLPVIEVDLDAYKNKQDFKLYAPDMRSRFTDLRDIFKPFIVKPLS